MTALTGFLSSDACARLVVTLLHTLWQGAVAAGLLYVALRTLRAGRTSLRYALSLTALAGVVVCALLTWGILSHVAVAASPDAPSVVAQTAAGIEPAPAAVQPGNLAPLAPAAVAPARLGWTGWLSAAWLAGVALMLVRACFSVRGASMLGRRSRPLDDANVQAIFDALRASLGLARRVRLAVCESVAAPAVLGVFRSVVLLPPSMLSGLSAEQLRAVLAHELAHVRRYDYLVNLLQMLVEAMGFFNPAVWWISRQVRIEREAACDAVAAQATGQPGALAGALAWWAERRTPARAPVAAAAFAGERDGSLLERVRRIASPGHRPALRVSWAALAACLLVSALVLVGLSRGAAVAVDAAAKILTPEERVKHIEALRETYGALHGNPDDPENRVTLVGVVRTEDGAPAPKSTTLTIHSQYPSIGYTTGYTLQRGDGSFSVPIQFGEIHIQVHADGYAPAFAGPFHSKPGGTVENIKFVLEHGFEASVKVVNAANQPVAKARVTAAYIFPPGTTTRSTTAVTDAAGVATFANCVKTPVQLDVEADGYQYDRTETKFSPDKPFAWTIRAARPTTGVVLSDETGKPVAGAVVRLAQRTGFAGCNWDPQDANSPRLATTDEQGRFRLTTLRDDSEHVLSVSAKGFAWRFVYGVRSGTESLQVRLGPEIFVRGRIIGPLEKLGGRRKTISWDNPYTLGNGSYSNNHSADVEIRDGEATFAIRDLHAGKLRIDAGGKRVRLELTKSVENLVIDLNAGAPAEKRTVELKFIAPKGAPEMKGTVTVSYVPKDIGGGASSVYRTFDIEDGRISVEVAGPGDFTCWPWGAVGYYFNDVSVSVPAGTEPLVVEVPCTPAGAIHGEAFEPDGKTPAANVQFALTAVTKPKALGNGYFGPRISSPGEGRFIVTPLPLGGTYQVTAFRGRCYVPVEPVKLDDANPTPALKIRMVEGVRVRVQVLAPDGKPAVGEEVDADYSGPHSHGFSGPPLRTDGEGRLTLEHVNPDAPGTYALVMRHPKGCRPVSQAFNPRDGSITVRLVPGKVVTGRVLDDATGKPLAGVEVYATGQDRADHFEGVEAEARTNEAGEFRISSMGEGVYNLHVREYNDAAGCPATGGQAKPVELRVKPWPKAPE